MTLSDVIDGFLKDFFHQHQEDLPRDLYRLVLSQVEQSLIRETLHLTHGNQKKAADILGIHRNTLKGKMLEFKIDF